LRQKRDWQAGSLVVVLLPLWLSVYLLYLLVQFLSPVAVRGQGREALVAMSVLWLLLQVAAAQG
jgi:uncharacterized membrane protein